MRTGKVVDNDEGVPFQSHFQFCEMLPVEARSCALSVISF